MDVCLYHGSDLDGKCCGAIFHKAHPDGKLYPIDYGDEVPWGLIAGADLTVMDWSFQPWANFVRAMQTAKSIVWIDHHKSAITDWETSEVDSGCYPVEVVLNVDYAACELAWMHFFPERPVPEMPYRRDVPFGVRMLGRYDVWKHEDPRVLWYQYGMRILDTDPRSRVWISVLTTGENDPWHQERIKIGQSLLTYQEQNDAAAVQRAWFPVVFEGLRWQACNRLGKGSRFFDSVWDPDKFDGMLSFGWDGEQWECGLYSDKAEMDCGAIAKKHFGGGHPGAAGFRCDVLPFMLSAD